MQQVDLVRAVCNAAEPANVEDLADLAGIGYVSAVGQYDDRHLLLPKLPLQDLPDGRRLRALQPMGDLLETEIVFHLSREVRDTGAQQSERCGVLIRHYGLA